MSSVPNDRLSLNILVCDRDPLSHSLLVPQLHASSLVSSVEIIESINNANNLLSVGKYNTVFIDPLALGLDDASAFIFDVRRRRPNIVFVLFLDRAVAESQRDSFYQGPRSRSPTTTLSTSERHYLYFQ
jgi:hypothetical protein